MVIFRKQFLNTSTLAHASECRNEEEFPNLNRAALAVYTDSYMGMARAGRKIGDAFPPRFIAKFYYGFMVMYSLLRFKLIGLNILTGLIYRFKLLMLRRCFMEES